MKLNLGSGKCPLEGYDNIDIKDGRKVYPLKDVEDGSCTEIRASHVLEHFPFEKVEAVVQHWASKLAPGGVLKVAVPNFRVIAEQYLKGVDGPWQGYIMGGHVDKHDRHGVVFDEECLTSCFARAGLERIGLWQSDADDCSALPISLNMCGTKPLASEVTLTGVHGLLASARFGPAAPHQCLHNTLRKVPFPFTMYSGCFWNQNWCNLADEVSKDPAVEWILSFDYDTIFQPEDIIDLYRLTQVYTGVDAVAAVQSKRGAESYPLFNLPMKDGKKTTEVSETVFHGNLTRISTAHFGLTLINAEKLRAMPKPWMNAKPNADGRWEDGHVDADIDFWNNWERQGNSLWLANKVRVGHIEEVVKWPGKRFEPVYQGMKDFHERGKPLEIQQCA